MHSIRRCAKIDSRAALSLLLALAVLAGCAAPRSQRCREMCRREARCVDTSEETELTFDADECEAACTALERDAEGKRLVDDHATCLGQAESCEQVLACM